MSTTAPMYIFSISAFHCSQTRLPRSEVFVLQEGQVTFQDSAALKVTQVPPGMIYYVVACRPRSR